MFATLFGLSMDYEVFLLSRVREAWLRGRDTSGAVTEGLTRTAGRDLGRRGDHGRRLRRAGAVSPEVFLKLIGIGLATAVLVDATIVRLVLVPAVMQILGERNWWMPRWLDAGHRPAHGAGRPPAVSRPAEQWPILAGSPRRTRAGCSDRPAADVRAP